MCLSCHPAWIFHLTVRLALDFVLQQMKKTMHSRWILIPTITVWLVLVWRTGPPTGDFANYWTAAALWLEGDPLTQLYDYRWFTAQAARLGFADRLVGFAVLTPPSALLAVPLAGLSVGAAGQVWWAGQGLLGLLLAWLMARGRAWPVWAGMVAVLLAWPVLRAHLVQGQFHLPVAVCLAGGLWAWQARRDGLAGVALGLAVGLKVHAWPVLVVAMLARRWRTAGAAMGTLVVGGAVSVALLGWPVHALWLSEIAPAAARGWFVHPWHLAFQSLSAGLRHALLPHPGLNPAPLGDSPAAVSAILAGFQPLIVGLTAASALSWPTLSPTQRDRILAAAACAAMVSGPILSHYHLVLLLPAVAWAAGALLEEGRPKHAAAVVGVAVLTAWWPVPLDLAGDALLPGLLVALPRLWLALLLWGLMVPWRLGRVAWLGRGGAVILAVALAMTAAEPPSDPDGAVPRDDPAFPLISAELVGTEDGSLWWSGLPTDRQGHPGQGWVGYRLAPGQAVPEVVAWDETAHAWAPTVSGPDTVDWQHGAIPPIDPTRPGPDSGTLTTIERDGQRDLAWVSPSGEMVPITSNSAHDTDPVWDASTQRIWFLSDRGVGVRTLRLWSVSDDLRSD
ncbi:MAG: hypothetical protein ACI8RZ_001336 [Myxococcota bacterium]|jgi:hypothetical protein